MTAPALRVQARKAPRAITTWQVIREDNDECVGSFVHEMTAYTFVTAWRKGYLAGVGNFGEDE